MAFVQPLRLYISRKLIRLHAYCILICIHNELTNTSGLSGNIFSNPCIDIVFIKLVEAARLSHMYSESTAVTRGALLHICDTRVGSAIYELC